MKDIANELGLTAVGRVVSEFYDRVQQHQALAEPFSIVHDWTEHKAHLTHFWWVTLGGKRYREQPYSVAQKHAAAGFTPALLVEWLALFKQTLNAHLPREYAEEWYARAVHIGRSLVLMHEFHCRKNTRQAVDVPCR
jgi:hemoglobin